MPYLIGTDEAGYGPNLGPLVVSATVWKVPERLRGEDLYGRLREVIAAAAGEAGGARVAMADSKVLYQSGKGLRHLERGLLAALAVLDRRPTDWTGVWDALDPQSAAARNSLRWYADYRSALPVDANPAEIRSLGPVLRDGLAAADVRLVELQSRAVFPREFNQLLEQYGSKGTALSHLTLELLARVMAPLEVEPIWVICDKHGGRNRYGPLLAEHFPDWLIEVYGEGRSRSVYRFGPGERRVEIRFQTKAESYLPAALASMASKYLRELAMRAFNEFWCRRTAGLRPTAGYPQDAKRFKARIAAVQAELRIEDEVLWRVK